MGSRFVAQTLYEVLSSPSADGVSDATYLPLATSYVLYFLLKKLTSEGCVLEDDDAPPPLPCLRCLFVFVVLVAFFFIFCCCCG